MAIKILLGGSPCTYWSIAQKNNRETVASGLGWELFCNYLVAKQKFNPDIFLYENNKSASQVIKDQIKQELKVWDGTLLTEDSKARYIEIDSALLSAQTRKRFYVHNCGDICQPQDKRILVNDILENGEIARDISKARTVTKCYANYTQRDFTKDIETSGQYGGIGVANAVMFNVPHGFNKGGIKYGKAPTLTANGAYEQNNFVVQPFNGMLNNTKCRTLTANYYKTSVRDAVVECAGGRTMVIETANGKQQPVYEVSGGQITIKGKQYPVKLVDGYYTMRKLSVTECCRLQTLPDNYCIAVSPTQGYKGLGNGWTADVICYILWHALKDVPKDEPLIVLSMYDGIGTGRYCLDKLGFTNIKYYAYEIDEFAMKVANSNYPDIIQCGDAYKVLADDWRLQC